MHDWIVHNLELVHMDHAMDKKPSEISGGMKQRVGIERKSVGEGKSVDLGWRGIVKKKKSVR